MINLYVIDNKNWRASAFGIGTYITELSLALNQSNLNITIIYLNSNSTSVLQSIENGVNHWHIPRPKLENNKDTKLNDDDYYYKSVVYILRQNIIDKENIIFHFNYYEFSQLVRMLKNVFDCKVVLAVHYQSWSFKLSGNLTRLQKIISKPVSNLDSFYTKRVALFNNEKELYNTIDKVLCLSKYTAKIIQSIYKVKKRKISTIYNGLEDKTLKIVDKELVRKKYYLPLKSPIIFFAGRLVPDKGLSYLIQASKKVLEQFPNAHVIIAGSGDYDTFIKDCGNRWMNIHFTGLLEKSELYELYSIADFGVMPSLHEQCSYVAIEMMMHGLPIIGSTTTGLKEMIVNGKTGLHVPVVEFEDNVEIEISLLAEKIIYLLKNEVERKNMGINARKRYRRLYSSSIMGEKMIEFYQSLWED